MDKASMTLGYLVGRQIAGQRRTQEKEPIAYLYNGVRLPPVPQYDKGLYPFAFMYTYELMGGDVYNLHIGKALYYDTKDNGKYCFFLKDSMECFLSDSETGIWGNLSETGYDANSYVDDVGNFWANFDILDEDGTLYLAASDPIPVYE